jgi:L-seryl-tRNA(Ser) seleniumtransferase
LQATLLHYVRGEALREIPVWRMISAQLDALERRASILAAALAERGIAARVAPLQSAVGGGSLPGETLPSAGLAISVSAPDTISNRLRGGRPPVVGRVAEGELLLDLRTVQPEEDEMLLAALTVALEAGEVKR